MWMCWKFVALCLFVGLCLFLGLCLSIHVNVGKNEGHICMFVYITNAGKIEGQIWL